jgi:hypothetical protein
VLAEKQLKRSKGHRDEKRKVCAELMLPIGGEPEVVLVKSSALPGGFHAQDGNEPGILQHARPMVHLGGRRSIRQLHRAMISTARSPENRVVVQFEIGTRITFCACKSTK